MQQEFTEEQVSIKDYIRILYRGRWIIAVSFILVLAVTVYFTFTAQPVFEAKALVMIRERGNVQQQVFEVSSFMKQETMINNQKEILESRTLAEDVIKRLQHSPYADSLSYLGNYRNGNNFSPKQWLLSLLKGKSDKKEASDIDDFVDNFRSGGTSVTPQRDTDMIEVSVQAPTPFEAAFVANEWVKAFQELDIEESRGEVTEVRKFLENKLEEVKTRLTDTEESLKEYKERANIVELDSETEQLVEVVSNFKSLYEQSRTELEATENRLEHLHDQLDESQAMMLQEVSSMSSPEIVELRKQLAVLIGGKAALEQQAKDLKVSSEYSKIQQKEMRIKGIKEKIRSEIQRIVESGGTALNPMAFSENLFTSVLELEAERRFLDAKASALQKIVARYDRIMNNLPEKSLKLARLKREQQVANNIFIMLRNKYEENRIAEASRIGSVRIVDNAIQPKEPIKPKKKVNLILGVLLGLGLGVGLTFAREYFDNSLKTIEDLEHMGFSVLGSIPFIKAEENGKKKASLVSMRSRLITHHKPKSPVSESYRTLRTNLQFLDIDHPVKTLVLTSAGPGEGKSTTVANVAITFAQMGSKVLLVDTDLRKPIMHRLFGVSRDVGLTNFLINKMDLKEVVIKTEINGLDIMTSGPLPPNPSELLSSRAMINFIEEVKKKYDMIFFDTPPVIAVTDATVLSSKLDGAVLIVKSSETDREALKRAHTQLENVKARVFGTLLNGVHMDDMFGSYYYYYYRQYYGDGSTKRKKRKKSFKEKLLG